MDILQHLKNNILYLDGGMGTLLQERGLAAGELPERWNLSHPDVITAVHKQYFDAGSNVINANTFGANCLKFSSDELDAIIGAAIKNARRAAAESATEHPKWVALDIGPTGKMLAPYGDLDFEDAVSVFAETVRLGVRHGADLIFIETMNDSYETRAALLAAKENSNLPVFVSCAFGEDGKLMTGADPAAMVAMLEGMGADAIGINCSFGPRKLMGVIEEYLKYASIPVLFKPNAGLPSVKEGRTVYDLTPNDFATDMKEAIALGVRAVGGCCGTTPEYIAALVEQTNGLHPQSITQKNITCVSSYTHAVIFDKEPILIGERINPTGKKKFKEALQSGDMDYILREGLAQADCGVHILDVNVGLPEIDEVTMLRDTVCRLQEVTDLPLQIDTSNPVAMEAALRRYNGKAMLNSVNGKMESMQSVFPLVKKYGGLVVALTLDESGIPTRAEERVAIAERILTVAAAYGIDKKDIIFDPLALTISADPTAAKETLRAVSIIKHKLGCHTSLGVSNVSFGLPGRDIINSTFFAMALSNGLSAAIMNPYSAEMMKTYHAFCALDGQDENCASYIDFAQSLPTQQAAPTPIQVSEAPQTEGSELQKAVIKGLRDRAAALTREELKTRAPLEVVQADIIPALDVVGEGFEKKTVYLPQLLMAAEAAKAAFEEVKAYLPAASNNGVHIVLATVKGDIHDIGKNIVKLLLENYGFAVTDLGRDVSPEAVVSEVVRLHAPIAGLSALMTTTVPAMEETIRQLRDAAPWCKIVVGGAVLTEEYAAQIGADKYAKDAMETVRYAETFLS
jgi:5-methyltetrahydrofolate--homocysteine methyltransferase